MSEPASAAGEGGLRYRVGDDGIATLTLDRPDKRNAVMPEDWRAMETALDDGAADSRVRRSRELLRMTRAIQRFRETPKPIVAAVNGPAIGAGFVIALACDVRVAKASAVFSVPFLRVGMQPDFGGAYFLPRLVGTARTFELLWTGDSLTADEALRDGLVNRVYADDAFEREVAELARRIARNPAGALATSKLTVYHGAEQTLAELLDLEALAQTVLSKSD